MKGKHFGVLAMVLVILGLGYGAWALWGDSVDPAVAALEDQRQQVFSGQATEADRQAFRQQVETLTDDQRRQLFERGRPDMQARMSERMGGFFAGSPEEIRREVTNRVDGIVAARRRRAAEQNSSGATSGNSPGAGERADRRERFENMTDAERDQRRKQRLDFVDAETRGQISEMRRLVNQELESRGEPPMEGPDFRAMMGGGR